MAYNHIWRILFIIKGTQIQDPNTILLFSPPSNKIKNVDNYNTEKGMGNPTMALRSLWERKLE